MLICHVSDEDVFVVRKEKMELLSLADDFSLEAAISHQAASQCR